MRPIALKTADSVMAFLRDYHERHGYFPSIREICVALGGMSTSTVHGHLKRLERDGAIKRGPHGRSIAIIKNAERTSSTPTHCPNCGSALTA